MQRYYLRSVGSLSALFVLPFSTFAFVASSRPAPSSFATGAHNRQQAFVRMASATTSAPPAPNHGIPGQDLTEEQPVRHPISSSSVVLVVGGNRGIGLEFVKQCADRGAQVIATHRSSELPQALVDLQATRSDSSESTKSIEALSMDVADEDSVSNAAMQLQERKLSPLTHIIHSAGVYPTGMSLDGTARGGRPKQPRVTKEDMMTSYLINAVGPVLVAQAFSPLLGMPANCNDDDENKDKLPVYAILSSKVGSVYDNTSGGTYAYRSSKAAVNNICRSLSVDLAGLASVVCLHPGYVRTDMTNGNGLIDKDESVAGMLRAIEATDGTVGFRFVDYKACIIPW